MQDWDEPLIKYPLEDKGVGQPRKRFKKRYGLITHHVYSHKHKGVKHWNHYAFNQWYVTEAHREEAYRHAIKNINNSNVYWYSKMEHVERIER